MTAALITGLGLAASAGWALRDYFQVWARSPQLYVTFDGGLRDIGEYISRLPRSEQVYVTPAAESLYTLRYFLGDDFSRVHTFDGRDCLVVPAHSSQPTHEIVAVWPGEDDRSLDRLPRFYPEGRSVWELVHVGATYAVDFLIPGGVSARLPEEVQPVHASVGNAATLLGYSLSSETIRRGESLTVNLLWQAAAPPSQQYAVFVNLTGPAAPGQPGTIVWTQAESGLCQNTFLRPNWQPGDWVYDDYVLTAPADAPPGRYTLVAGWVEPATGQRLPVEQDLTAGQLLSADAIQLTPVTLEAAQ